MRCRPVRGLPLLETVLLMSALGVLTALAVFRAHGAAPAAFESYSTYDASPGGYRAWYELLGREGVRVERFERRPAFLGSSVDTLVYSEPLPFDPHQQPATRADAAALEAWVRGGGRLLYVGHDDAAAKEGILSLPFAPSALARRHIATVDAVLGASGVRRVVSASPLRYRRSKRREQVLLDDGSGPLALSYALGRGRVTALVDERLLANGSIGSGDNARLAFALARPGRGATGTVAFDENVHGYAAFEHWWQIVPVPFAFALAVAAVGLLIAFAGAAVRLGPPILPVPRTDRSTADFIEASATLLERGGAAGTAMREAGASATRAIARALGETEQVNPATLAARIEREEPRRAFLEMLEIARSGAPGERTFVRGVALAQRLRKAGPHGGARD